jgi:hypothetical protein
MTAPSFFVPLILIVDWISAVFDFYEYLSSIHYNKLSAKNAYSREKNICSIMLVRAVAFYYIVS